MLQTAASFLYTYVHGYKDKVPVFSYVDEVVYKSLHNHCSYVLESSYALYHACMMSEII